MKNLSKRPRRLLIAVISFLVFWLAYDIWDHARHPVFWGLSYLIRVPHPYAYEKKKNWSPLDRRKANLAKLHAEGFAIQQGPITNITKFQAVRLKSGTTNLVSDTAVETNVFIRGIRVSDIASNHASLSSIPIDDDIIRASSNMLLMVDLGYGGQGGSCVELTTVMLAPAAESVEDMERGMLLPIDAYPRENGECTLRRNPNGLIIVSIATSFDYMYVAIDPATWNPNELRRFVDSRDYEYGRDQAGRFKRDFSQIIFAWECYAFDFIDLVSSGGYCSAHLIWQGRVLLSGVFLGIVGGILALLSHRFRDLVRRHRRITVAVLTLALGSLAFAALFLFV